MKITDIQTARLDVGFKQVLVKVYTDEGITGIGEACWGQGVKDIIRSQKMKSILVGQDPLDVNRLLTRMIETMSGEGSQAGSVVTAISGIELALWDLAGKALGVPVYRLLGGKYRDKIRIYADCHGGKTDDPESWAATARSIKKMGYTALKFDIDTPEHWREDFNRCLSTTEIRTQAEKIAAVREAVGDDVDIAVDCHWRYSTKDAVRLAKALAQYGLLWLEDPIPPWNIDAMHKVTSLSPVPICTGENLYLKHGFRRLIERQAADIVAPDIPKVGGILEFKRISDMADTYYIPVAPHNVSSPIGTMASAHACASIKNFLVMEVHHLSTGAVWWEDLVKEEKPIIEKGYIKIRDKPGIGLELDEKEVSKHLLEVDRKFFE
ncbi:MAG: mandelate racemase/muconate lactonizing enzyme family protein [Candidatus Bathyarchaeia archaeon]